MKYVFMGTPDFAVRSLLRLRESSHELLGVVTVPDKPAGRGQRVRYAPVKQAALDFDVPILQPDDLHDPAFVERLQAFDADVFAVVAFRILPEEVFTIPPAGTINLHASLLPKYRGAAPINWAIINGETETGVTTIVIKKEVDAGDMILQEKIAIGPDETAGELHDRLANLGAETLCRTMELLQRGAAQPQKQQGGATRAPKITRETCRIDWSKSNVAIRNLVRGLAPRPGAFSFLGGKLMKIYRAELADLTSGDATAGEIVELDAKTGRLIVATGGGGLQLAELQPEGKRRMTAQEFLRGAQLKTGDVFGRE